jgi:hypothetical protein
MSAEYTPGPWVVYDDSNNGKTNRIEIAARGKTVARIYHSVPEEDLPNARLIAAAPDLLEALQLTVLQLTVLHLTNPMALQITRADLVKKAQAIIAKATGDL